MAEEGGAIVAFGSVDPDPATPASARSAPGCGSSIGAAASGPPWRRSRSPSRASRATGASAAASPAHNEPALSYLSAMGALVPLTNPGASFELPLYPEPS